MKKTLMQFYIKLPEEHKAKEKYYNTPKKTSQMELFFSYFYLFILIKSLSLSRDY